MERDQTERVHVWEVAPQPVGYLAGIVERLKHLGPPPPRQSRSKAPGENAVGDEA
jgi:hypothetical protein